MPISDGADAPMSFAVDAAEPTILYGSAPLLRCLRSVDDDGALHVSRVQADTAAGFAPSLPLGRGKTVSVAPENFWAEAFTLLAAGAVGAARVAVRDSVEYAKSRSAYDRPIAHFQGVSHRLADMHRDTELAWTAIVWAANGGSGTLPAIDAALRLSQAVVEAAIQIHGGIGFTWDMKLHFYLRHVIVLRRLTPVGEGGFHRIDSM
jgi:alkylation response protein AidB-like acyl-CoA dehydrogenase